MGFNRKEGVTGSLDTAYALCAGDYRGINRNQNQNAALYFPQGILRVGNIDPSGNGLNGNVYSENGLSPSLTTNKGEGVKVAIGPGPCVRVAQGTKRGYAEAGAGDSINLSFAGSLSRRGRVGKGVANTLDTGCNQGVLDGCRIRRLTPRECWRLQGVPDELFGRAALVCSDSQLYKQAGNGVTVNVVFEIARKLLAAENGGDGE